MPAATKRRLLRSSAPAAASHRGKKAADVEPPQPRQPHNRNDPYLVLLRRELVRAQARLRRVERERDALARELVMLKKRTARFTLRSE
jgi:hypothetical protein